MSQAGILNINASGVVVSPADGGTGVSNPTAHAIAIAEGSSPFNFVGPGTTGQVLQAVTNMDPEFSTATYPSTVTANEILYASSSTAIGQISTADNGVLITSGTGAPSISSTLPAAVQDNITSLGNIGDQSNTTRCCFSAYQSSSVTNVTGDGTTYTIVFDTKDFDQGTNYNAVSGTFTAPVTGKYFLYANCLVSGLTTAFTAALLSIVATGKITNTTNDPAKTFDVNNAETIQTSAIIAMNQGDTATVQLTVYEGTKVVGVIGGATGNETSFYAYLLC